METTAIKTHSAQQNKEGVTFREWVCAAGVAAMADGYVLPYSPLYYSSTALAAWSAGEDPTEWRADRAQKALVRAQTKQEKKVKKPSMTPPTKNDKPLTTGQLAAALNVPSRTVRRYVLTGKITGTQHPITKRWQITQANVDAFLQAQGVAQAQELPSDPVE